MARLFFQYLAIYDNINLLLCQKNCISSFEIWPNTEEPSKHYQIFFKLPQWRNFAESGHTVGESLGEGHVTFAVAASIEK